MPLGIDVDLGPGHIMLDGDPASPPQNVSTPPIFGPYLLWPNGWMDTDATWYGDRPQPSDIVLDGDPAPPPPKWYRSPNFQSMSIVAKWLDRSR